MAHRSTLRQWGSSIAVVTTAVAVLTVAGAVPSSAGSQTSLGAAKLPGGVTKIQHVVVLMQENRSYDSYFGALHFEGQPKSSVEPRRGNPDPQQAGKRIRPFLASSECTVADLNHSWNGTHQEWNGGRMNGFTGANADVADPTGSRAMGYFDQRVLPFYYGVANQFAIADHYFASTLTQTFPNRFYLLTGSSFGHIRNDFPPAGGFTQKTVFQLLDEATPKVTWKIYLALFQVEQLFSYVQQHSDHVATIQQYYNDAAKGTLPQVSFVESNGFGKVNVETDEHPPANVQVGAKFTHDIMNALVQSPDWSSSAMFLTYDEHGGYYDHVAPPAAPKPDNIAPMLQPGDFPAAFDRYGIRVPAIVVSPYAKQHYVSHTVYDHTSILRFIETRFGLPALTNRDKHADPMLGMFNFNQASHPNPVLPAAPIDPAGVAACTKLHP